MVLYSFVRMTAIAEWLKGIINLKMKIYHLFTLMLFEMVIRTLILNSFGGLRYSPYTVVITLFGLFRALDIFVCVSRKKVSHLGLE